MKEKLLIHFDKFCRMSSGYLMMSLILFSIFFLLTTRPEKYTLSDINYTERFVDSQGHQVIAWDFYSVKPSTELYCHLAAVETNTVMQFLTRDTFVSVYVDDRLMLEDTRPQSTFEGSSNGVSWKRVVIPPAPNGCTLKIVCTPAYSDKFCSISHCYIGAPTAVMYEIAFEHLPAFLISFFFLAVGVISMGLFFYYQLRYKTGQSFLYVGYTSVVTALWTILDTSMFSFFFGKSAVWTTLSYVVLMMLPLSIGLICTFHFTGKHKLYTEIYILVNEINLLLCCCLHFSGVLEFHYTRWMSFFLIILGIPLFLFMLFTYKHDKDMYGNHLILVIFVMTFLACISMWILRYVRGYVYNSSFIVRTSIICFQTCLIGYHLKNSMNMFRRNVENKVRHEIQILDPLTGLFNRSALVEKRMEYMNKDGKSKVAVLCFYINHLNEINAEYGFEAAMQIVMDFSSGLHYAFPESDCYKIDHQRFLVIIHSEYVKQIYRQGINNLANYCEEFNGFRNHPYKMEYSFAYEYDTNVGLFELIDHVEQKMQK